MLALLLAAAACAVGFVVVYALDRLPTTRSCSGRARPRARCHRRRADRRPAQRLVVTEELEDDYPAAGASRGAGAIAQIVEESGAASRAGGSSSSRCGGAGGALGLALLTPPPRSGRSLDIASLYATPWRRGRRLVDENGRPYRADDIEPDASTPRSPRARTRRQLASPLVIVRLPPS